jgi:hypothetical protein
VYVVVHESRHFRLFKMLASGAGSKSLQGRFQFNATGSGFFRQIAKPVSLFNLKLS